MFLEILIAFFLGFIAGTFSGLTPGIHVNLVCVILLSAAPWLIPITGVFPLIVFIVSMAITHTFLDTLPSIFLGAPDADNVAIILPGHKLLLEGKGHEAVKLTIAGSFLSLILSIMLVPLLIFIVPWMYDKIEFVVGWLILLVVIFMILKEKTLTKKLWAFLVFSISGLLGMIVLDFPSLDQPLLPLLSGLFGVSGLLMSLNDDVLPPPQSFDTTVDVETSTIVQALFAAVTSGWLASLLPGLGSAQAAILSGTVFRNLGNYGYLILVGGINTVNFLLSLVTLYTLDKARNGAVIVVQQLVEKISLPQIIVLMIVALLAGAMGTLLCLWMSRVFISLMDTVSYPLLCWIVICIIVFFVFLFSGMYGFLVLAISTAVGMIPVLAGIGRNHSMGCLLIPVLLYFLV
ncbi:tripartite tricarboxylate transporter permease [Candidatus Woesearchaeota archaeon]|nr:tripartite tricarboxylate transporter permease [Candidatus Woesearchaeota archaeon]